ncbi:MAG TPA: hypothetical protein DCZ01_07490 [Elusimicrobia bacterium]|nr:hypothetical protein [Elusimicrobiota bacterium]
MVEKPGKASAAAASPEFKHQGIDCSALTQNSYGENRVKIPRVSRDQWKTYDPSCPRRPLSRTRLCCIARLWGLRSWRSPSCADQRTKAASTFS